MPKNIYLVDTELDNVYYSVPEIPEITIGRGGIIKIPCRFEKSVRVSRIHCRLFRKDLEKFSESPLSIIDGESDKKPSKNGTYVDGERTSNKTETQLYNNSLLSLADYELRVVIEESETMENSDSLITEQ